MDIGIIFNLVGGLFALAALVYFTWEYVIYLPETVKLLMLALLTAIFYVGADVAEGRGY